MSSIEHQRSRKRTSQLFKKVIQKSLRRTEKLSVSTWAERKRILGEASNFKGKWSNDMTPYLVGIMDAFTDQYIQEINFVKPTQVGGTEAMLNMLGWIITEDPAPTMIVYPTDELAKDTSNERIKPSLNKTPEIAERFIKNASKELNLKYRGMSMYLRGAGSPSKLASKAIKYLFFDEIDKMDGASKKEASPYNLARERTRTYTYSKKIYTCSTPTLKTNYVWNIHENADVQREYFVPCPHCEDEITFRFPNIKFRKEDDEGNLLSDDARARSAVYACQSCGCEISDKDKLRMIRQGRWKDVKKKSEGKPRKVSFWMNALYSPFLTWEDIVIEFLSSKNNPDEFQNFVNSWLAEPWEDTKLKTTNELVLQRQTEYEEFEVPDWAQMLTGGVDVQENCLYWTIRAFGPFFTSQNIAHGQAMSFQEIENIMNYEYEKRDGTKLIIELAAIDSGDQTDDVYDFCANNSDWAIPVKGSSHAQLSSYKLSKINKEGSRAYGMNLLLVDGGKYKDMIAGRMQRENGLKSWMVYKGCDDEYAKQVTSEHKVNVKNGKTTYQEWVKKTSHADNHYLDCEVYAMAAADIRGARTLHLKQINETQGVAAPEIKQTNTSEESWISKNENWIEGG